MNNKFYTKLLLRTSNIFFLQGSLLFCDACDKGYHMQCHVPPLNTMPIGKIVTVNSQTNITELKELHTRMCTASSP